MMRLTIVFAAFYLALTLSGCAKKADDCDGGCKGWKPAKSSTSAAQDAAFHPDKK